MPFWISVLETNRRKIVRLFQWLCYLHHQLTTFRNRTAWFLRVDLLFPRIVYEQPNRCYSLLFLWQIPRADFRCLKKTLTSDKVKKRRPWQPEIRVVGTTAWSGSVAWHLETSCLQTEKARNHPVILIDNAGHRCRQRRAYWSFNFAEARICLTFIQMPTIRPANSSWTPWPVHLAWQWCHCVRLESTQLEATKVWLKLREHVDDVLAMFN